MRKLLALGLICLPLLPSIATAQVAVVSSAGANALSFAGTPIAVNASFARTTSTGGLFGLGTASIQFRLNFARNTALLQARMVSASNPTSAFVDWGGIPISGAANIGASQSANGSGHIATVPASANLIIIQLRVNGDTNPANWISTPPIYAGTPIQSFADMIDSMGVNGITLQSAGCNNPYCDYNEIGRQMNYLGLYWMRGQDAGENSSPRTAAFNSLKAIVPNLHAVLFKQCDVNLATHSALSSAWGMDHVWIEGPNEVNVPGQGNNCTTGYGMTSSGTTSGTTLTAVMYAGTQFSAGQTVFGGSILASAATTILSVTQAPTVGNGYVGIYTLSAAPPTPIASGTLMQVGGWKGLTFQAAELQFQKDLFAARETAGLHGMNMTTFTRSIANSPTAVWYWDATPANSDMSAYTQWVAVHPYVGSTSAPYNIVAVAKPYQAQMGSNRGMIATEQGWSSSSNGNGMTEEMQAINNLVAFLDQHAQHIARSFLYQLQNSLGGPATDYQSNFGQFNAVAYGGTATPKMAATAIHNLTTMLADTGTNPIGRMALPVTISQPSLTALQQTFSFNQQFAKSDGSGAIVTWMEPNPYYWNSGTFSINSQADVPTTLTFTASHTYHLIDLITGSTIQSDSTGTAVTFNQNTHPIGITIH